MADKTHWKKLENPDYLGAYALQPGQDLTLQIKSVGQEEVYNVNSNKKETCTDIKKQKWLPAEGRRKKRRKKN